MILEYLGNDEYVYLVVDFLRADRVKRVEKCYITKRYICVYLKINNF